MKTLEEVIEAERHCIGNGCRGCPYDIVTYGGSCECNEDVLHYLEAFRDAKNSLDTERDRYAEAVRNCEIAENKYRELCKTSQELRNDPLTWQELKTMEGKPVWLETCGFDENGDGKFAKKQRWVIVHHFGDEVLQGEYPQMTFITSEWADAGIYVKDNKVSRRTLDDEYYRITKSYVDFGKTWQAYRKERTG